MENLNDLGEYLNTEIVCTLAGLGYSEGSDYYKSPDCLESLKDLVRFLRRDDTTCEIRRQLGYSEVLQNDLVAILKSCSSKEKEIFDMVVRLMVNLTQPAVLCFGNNIPEDRTGQHYYLDLVTQLQSYKEAFTEKEVMSVIGRELGRLLQMEWDDRLEEDSLLIERILLLIRNILHIPANKQAEKRTDDDASIHDQVIWNLHANGIDDLLLFIASSPDERRWSMHVLEIVSLMLREQNAESLAKAGEGRSRSEKKDDEKQLEILRQQELADKLNNARKFSGRHSRFGGTFHVQNLKSINDKNQLIYHRPLAEVKNMSFDHNKTAPKKRKKQLPAKEMGEERRSTLSIRLFLKNFCKGFLQNCYNPLMNVVKDNLKHGRSQENDETYFLWAMRFFMEFSRHHDFRVDYISETLSVVSFTDLLNIIIKFYDGYESNKAEAVIWSRRLHLAIQAYKELILNVMWMDKADEDNLRENSKIIKGNIFYTAEYRDTFLMLLRKFNISKQTKSYLRDLIEAFHIFLKMLEKYCSGKTHIVVQKKKKVVKKKKRSARSAPGNLTAEEVEQKWQDLASDLSATLQGHGGQVPESVVPFDAASEIPVDEQRSNALSQIQGFLRNQQCGNAVALLRAARDVWADDEQFGSAGIGAEDEFMCLNEIFKMDLPSVTIPVDNDASEDGEDEEDTIPEQEEMAAVQTRETEFSIQDFLNKLAAPSVIQPYSWLLKYYKENKEFTNHAIIKMLHRVAVDLKTPSMLFQLSLFGTFQKILSDPAANQYKEMVKFSRYIVAKFFEKLPKNPVLLAELVIWKNAKDCYELEEGYGSLEFRSASTNAATWTFEEEEELKQLYEECKGSDDLVDTLMEKLSNDTRSRRQIMNKLVAMKLVTNRKELHKKPAKKGVWSEEEVEQLRALYEEYKNSEEDIVEKIMEHMLDASRTRRQVVNQLVNMGAVEDRKMLRKKRKKGERKRKKDDGFVVDDDNEDEESADGRSNQEEGFDHPPSSSDEESEDDNDDDDDLVGGDDTLTNIITKLKGAGLSEQLKWIQSKLRRTADDRENADKEKWQPLPLVTITEENEEALSNKLFKRALMKVGLKPPANEQETFWRIPVVLNPERLRRAAEDLDENGAGDEAEPSTASVGSKSKSRKETLAALAAARKKKSGSTSSRKRKERRTKRSGGKEWRKTVNDIAPEGSNENHRDDEPHDTGETTNDRNKEPPPSGDHNDTSTKEAKKRGKRRVKAVDDSDEDEDDTENETNQQNGNVEYGDSEEEGTKKGPSASDTTTKRRPGSDSEEDDLEYSRNMSDAEDSNNNAAETRKSEAGRKRPRSDNDDDSSDDDEEFNVPLSHHKKARRVLVDDDDEDE